MPATLADIQRKYGDSVYPLYKDEMHEPYMENENNNGYLGVVLYDENEDKIQCAICGNWYSRLHTTGHLRVHKLTTTEYKDKFGILRGVQLQSKKISKIQSKCALRNKNFMSISGSGQGLKEVHQEKANMVSNKKRNSVGYRNKKGLCDAQVVARLHIVRDVVGKSPSDSDLRKYDKQVQKFLEYHYGTANKGLRHYGFKTYKSGGQKGSWRYSDTQLLGLLRKFVLENKEIPTSSDCGGSLPKWDTFVSRFGSWRRAKMMAGLDQLLNSVK